MKEKRIFFFIIALLVVPPVLINLCGILYGNLKERKRTSDEMTVATAGETETTTTFIFSPEPVTQERVQPVTESILPVFQTEETTETTTFTAQTEASSEMTTVGERITQSSQEPVSESVQTEETTTEESTAFSPGDIIDTLGIIGKRTETAYRVILENDAGKIIKGISVRTDGGEYSSSLLPEGTMFRVTRQMVLYVEPVEPKVNEKGKIVPPVYDLQLTFLDDTQAEIHTFPFGDADFCEIHVKDDIAYLKFSSLSLKSMQNTLEAEKAVRVQEKLKADQAAAQEEQQSSWEYDDYDDSYYEDYDSDYDYDYDYYYEDIRPYEIYNYETGYSSAGSYNDRR